MKLKLKMIKTNMGKKQEQHRYDDPVTTIQ